MATNFKKVSLSLHKDTIELINYMVEKRKMSSPSELVRELIRLYYEGDFRRDYGGYFSGLDSTSRKLAKDAKSDLLSETLAMVDTITDDHELTLKLKEIGFINDEVDHRSGYGYSIFTIMPQKERVFRLAYLNGSTTVDIPWDEFKRELAKFLKTKQ